MKIKDFIEYTKENNIPEDYEIEMGYDSDGDYDYGYHSVGTEDYISVDNNKKNNYPWHVFNNTLIMTQEDKPLLLKDLCARLPYGVKVENTSFSEPQIHTLFGRVSDDEFLMLETYKSVGGEDYRRVTDDVHYTGYLESIKPYLRPISSMTEEEMAEYESLYDCIDEGLIKVFDWLNKKMFDYRGLIEKGLALKAKEGMYKFLRI